MFTTHEQLKTAMHCTNPPTSPHLQGCKAGDLGARRGKMWTENIEENVTNKQIILHRSAIHTVHISIYILTSGAGP